MTYYNDRKIYAKRHIKETKDILWVLCKSEKPLRCIEIANNIPYRITPQQVSCLIEYNLKPYIHRDIYNDGKAYFSTGGNK